MGGGSVGGSVGEGVGIGAVVVVFLWRKRSGVSAKIRDFFNHTKKKSWNRTCIYSGTPLNGHP